MFFNLFNKKKERPPVISSGQVTEIHHLRDDIFRFIIIRTDTNKSPMVSSVNTLVVEVINKRKPISKDIEVSNVIYTSDKCWLSVSLPQLGELANKPHLAKVTFFGSKEEHEYKVSEIDITFSKER